MYGPKDVLYIEEMNNKERRSIQSVLYEVTLSLLQLLTPFLPHTTSDVYKHLPHHKEDDVYLENMPQYVDYNGSDLVDKYDKFMGLRDHVLKALEDARNNKVIGKSFNAKLTLYPNQELKTLLEQLHVNLQQVFIVSQLEIREGKGQYVFEQGSIDVEKAEGETCDRCWQVVEETKEGLCQRCESVVANK